MTQDDLATLQRAVASLEHPGLAARLTNMVGKPIELIGYALPASASQAITTATSKALELALQRSIAEIARREGEDLSDPAAWLGRRHDDGRDRKLDGKRGQTEGAARSTGYRGQGLVKA